MARRTVPGLLHKEIVAAVEAVAESVTDFNKEQLNFPSECLDEDEAPLSFECPESSSIQGARYDPDTRQMFITFRWGPRVCDCIVVSGNQSKPKQHGADPHAKNCGVYSNTPTAYRYGDIDPHLWEEFVQAMSKGKFVSARIRPMYIGTKV